MVLLSFEQESLECHDAIQCEIIAVFLWNGGYDSRVTLFLGVVSACLLVHVVYSAAALAFRLQYSNFKGIHQLSDPTQTDKW
eukprot:1836307-Amphidinium_carterae.1